LFDPHYPLDQHKCHLSVMENAYVGIIIISVFYVNDT